MKNFAETIRLAAKIKEESYDRKMAVESMHKKYTDFNKFYKKDLREAIEEAIKKTKIDEEAKFPIYLLLRFSWNEALDWANQDIFK